MNIEQLTNMLIKHKVPISTWGNGEAKRIPNLLQEIESGETTFQTSDNILNGRLIRCIQPVVLYVYDPLTPTILHQLHETEHIYADNRVRGCHRDTSISEKLKPGESPEEGARRGLHEELGFSNDANYSLIKIGQDTVLTESTQSFPGLTTFRVRYFFVCAISRDLYKPDGYKEVQPGIKTVYFKWKPILIALAKPYLHALLSGLQIPK